MGLIDTVNVHIGYFSCRFIADSFRAETRLECESFSRFDFARWNIEGTQETQCVGRTRLYELQRPYQSKRPAVKEVHSAVDEVREHDWRQADAFDRERMVRKACGWRVIGRAIGAGALVTGAVMTASSVLTVACCVAAWRLVKPIRDEMRDACTYRSTGAKDEPRHW